MNPAGGCLITGGRIGRYTFTDVLFLRTHLQPFKKPFPACVCVFHPLFFTSSFSRLISSVVSDAVTCLRSPPDGKFVSDFGSVICTGRTISADNAWQLITAISPNGPTQLRRMKNKTVVLLLCAVNDQEW